MSLEIRELIIKVQVSENQPLHKGSSVDEQQLLWLKKEIMEECMEKVKQEMEKKKDR